MICQHTVGYTKHEISPSFPFLRYHIYKVFTIWPMLTPNDLWSRLGFLYSMWYTYIPNMRSVRASLLEISCLQASVTTHTHIHTHTRQHDCIGYDYHRNQKELTFNLSKEKVSILRADTTWSTQLWIRKTIHWLVWHQYHPKYGKFSINVLNKTMNSLALYETTTWKII